MAVVIFLSCLGAAPFAGAWIETHGYQEGATRGDSIASLSVDGGGGSD